MSELFWTRYVTYVAFVYEESYKCQGELYRASIQYRYMSFLEKSMHHSWQVQGTWWIHVQHVCCQNRYLFVLYWFFWISFWCSHLAVMDSYDIYFMWFGNLKIYMICWCQSLRVCIVLFLFLCKYYFIAFHSMYLHPSFSLRFYISTSVLAREFIINCLNWYLFS